MSYTAEQEKIVLKILSYKPHQFYEILSVEKTADEHVIKKSYRKLAVKLHPDKNPHPRAAEAFKILNKAWGVLGDPSKKTIYDQTGSDPDSRFGGSSSSGASPFARAGAGGSPFSGFQSGGVQFDEDIFNLFFGGPGRQQGPAFTFQTFGGGADPFVRQRRNPRTAQQHQQRPRESPEVNLFDTLKQILPLLLFLLVPIISTLFSESDSTPEYSFFPSPQNNVERTTPRYEIPFYVSEKYLEKKKLNAKQLRNFDTKVENLYVQDKRSKCSKEQILKNEMMEDAQGWFSTDQKKLKEAEEMPMPNCQALRKLGLI